MTVMERQGWHRRTRMIGRLHITIRLPLILLELQVHLAGLQASRQRIDGFYDDLYLQTWVGHPLH